uniref:Uncharacterized protein n=1 Tax=Arundo donax TaxID=35708 RepID=A0A0A8YTJ7_ARUDO
MDATASMDAGEKADPGSPQGAPAREGARAAF